MQTMIDAPDIVRRPKWETFVRGLWKLLRVPLFLLVLALLCTACRLVINLGIDRLVSARFQLYHLTDIVGVQILIWVVSCTTILMFAVAWTHYISPLAAGSGIPEIKSTLSGVELAGHLSFRTLVSKVGGLITAQGSGLEMGGEGPFVHVTGIISNLIMQLRIFRFILNNEALRLKLLSAGCAVGISDNFGAPVGGVLFSVEVTSSFFSVSSLPLNFFCAVSGAVMFLVFTTLVSSAEDIEQKAQAAGVDPTLINERHVSALFKVSYLPATHGWELIEFALLGVFMGTLGGLFVHLNQHIVLLRRRFYERERSRYTMPLIVIIITGILSCPAVIAPFMSLSPRSALQSLFAQRLLDADGWTGGIFPHQSIALFFFAVIRFLLLAVSFTLPVPSDVYTPSMVIGAALGRGIGELIRPDDYTPGGFAVVGAAAFAAGVTRTMSSAVIIFEMTGQISYAYPVLVAVLFAYLTGNKLSISIYDSIAKLRGLPVLGNFQKQKSYMRTVDEIMDRELLYITTKPTYLEIEAVLDAAPFAVYPVVEEDLSTSSHFLVGTITRELLENMLSEREEYVRFRIKGGLIDCNVELNEEEAQMLHELEAAEAEDAALTVTTDDSPTSGSMSHHDDGYGVGSLDRDSLKKEYRKSYREVQPMAGTPNKKKKSKREREVEMAELKCTRHAVHDAPRIRAKFMSSRVSINLDDLERHPFAISDVTPLRKVHFMFSVMGLSHAFVTNGGRLVGCVTKLRLVADDL